MFSFTITTFLTAEMLDMSLILFSFFSWLMQYLVTNFSDFQLACIGSFLLHESVFFLSGLPFIYLERAGFLSKFKIQVSLFLFSSVQVTSMYESIALRARFNRILHRYQGISHL